MKFEAIEIGKTYYSRYTEYHSGRNKKSENYRPYYILLKDDRLKKIMASCGGMPPLFYTVEAYKRWVAKVPHDAGQIKLRTKYS